VRALLAFACACLCVSAAPQGAARSARLPFAEADADRFAAKLAAIVARTPPSPGEQRRRLRTVVTEPEVNAYLRFRAKNDIPVGVVEPYVFALGEGRIGGEATVDLDAVRLSRPRAILDPAQLLRGRVPVTAAGVLRSKDGVFQFALESATVAGIDVPKALLQELVGYYSRSASRPAGFSLDEPFQLTAGIREITVEARKAIVVQ